MKLGIIVDTFPRWSERFIAREATELRRRGVELAIFSLKAGTVPDADPDWAELISRRIVLPSCMTPRFRTDKGNAQLQARVAAVKRELGLSFLFKLGCASALADLLRTEQITHVHAHFGNLPSTLGWLAASACGLPFTFSVHARDLFVEGQLLKEKTDDARRVFVCHQHGLAHLKKLVSEPDKVAYMRHGLPLQRFAYQQRTPRKSEVVRLLFAGRFVSKKGLCDLLAAIASPPLRSRNFELTLLGDGPGRKALSKQKLAKVRLQAPLCGAELQQAFSEADVLIAPYRAAADGDVDGVPNVVLEAFATGLPVIGSDAGGLKEVLSNETGSCVPAGDPEALARALAAYMDSPERALNKAKSARALVERDYDISHNIQPLLETLK